MIDWHSLFVYNLALFINVALAIISVRFFEKFNFIDLLNALVFTLIFGLRNGVGNDFNGYKELFQGLRLGRDIDTELLFLWLSEAYGFTFNGHIYLLASASFLTFFSLCIILRSLSILPQGIFVFYISELLFLVNDQVRQGLAIVLFFYTLRFLIDGSILKYAFSIIIISLFVHQSALFLLILYPIRYITFKKWFILGSIGMAFVLFISKKLYFIFFAILILSPGYNSFLVRGGRFLEVQELDSGLGFLFWIAFGSATLIFSYKNYHTTVYFKIFFIALISYILTIEFHLFNRLAAYLVYIKIIFIAHLLKNEKSFYPRILTLLMLSFFELEIALNLGKHGGFPYRNYLFP